MKSLTEGKGDLDLDGDLQKFQRKNPSLKINTFLLTTFMSKSLDAPSTSESPYSKRIKKKEGINL